MDDLPAELREFIGVVGDLHDMSTGEVDEALPLVADYLIAHALDPLPKFGRFTRMEIARYAVKNFPDRPIGMLPYVMGNPAHNQFAQEFNRTNPRPGDVGLEPLTAYLTQWSELYRVGLLLAVRLIGPFFHVADPDNLFRGNGFARRQFRRRYRGLPTPWDGVSKSHEWIKNTSDGTSSIVKSMLRYGLLLGSGYQHRGDYEWKRQAGQIEAALREQTDSQKLMPQAVVAACVFLAGLAAEAECSSD